QGRLGENLAQRVETSNDDFRINGLFKEERMKAKVRTQKGQHVDSVTGRHPDVDRLADRLPSVRHAGVEREAGLVKVIKIDLPSRGLGAKARQFGLRGLKVHFVAFATRAAPKALPGFLALLEDPFERLAADLFPDLLLDPGQAAFGGPRVLLDDFDRLLLLLFVQSWFASTPFLIVKTAGPIVFPAIKPVADRVPIDFVDVGDPIDAVSASTEQHRESASTH